MKGSVSKSLEEVWEMKKDIQDAFKKSDFESYAEFITSEMIELKKKYKVVYEIERIEKENPLTVVCEKQN